MHYLRLHNIIGMVEEQTLNTFGITFQQASIIHKIHSNAIKILMNFALMLSLI